MPGRLFHVEDDWFEWRHDPALAARVLVRVVRSDDGRVAIGELRVIGQPTSNVLRAIPIGRIEAAANAIEGWDRGGAPVATRPPRTARLAARLLEGTGRGRDDEFYSAVAAAYRELAHSSSRPAVDLAAANGVPVTTAHRWVKEARRRGMLAPGRPGKAG